MNGLHREWESFLGKQIQITKLKTTGRMVLTIAFSKDVRMIRLQIVRFLLLVTCITSVLYTVSYMQWSMVVVWQLRPWIFFVVVVVVCVTVVTVIIHRVCSYTTHFYLQLESVKWHFGFSTTTSIGLLLLVVGCHPVCSNKKHSTNICRQKTKNAVSIPEDNCQTYVTAAESTIVVALGFIQHHTPFHQSDFQPYVEYCVGESMVHLLLCGNSNHSIVFRNCDQYLPRCRRSQGRWYTRQYNNNCFPHYCTRNIIGEAPTGLFGTRKYYHTSASATARRSIAKVTRTDWAMADLASQSPSTNLL